MNYVTRYKEDIFSVVNKTIGDLNSLYKFLSDNTISIDNVPTGRNTTFTKAVSPPPTVKSAVIEVVNISTYRSRQNQTIYDVCLMTLTDLNKLYTLNFNNIISPPLAGSVFNFDSRKVSDNILSRYVKENGIVFNTGVSLTSGTAESGKEFQDGILFEFQDGIIYNYQQ